MEMRTVVTKTDFPDLNLISRGKVRDMYDLGDEVLIVVTDRLSAFDHVLPNGIPDKGRVLNLLSDFWFKKTAHIVKNQVVSTDTADLPSALCPHKDMLEGRFTIARKAKMLPVECVVRGYLSGSGWNDYRRTGAVCGIPLPAGLRESEKLQEPIFTPSTKADAGHDENISFEEASRLIGRELADKVRDTTLALYTFARDFARERGILIADTKFEFGLLDGELLLCDEVLTPDSSRFWPADLYEPGKGQPSFDKQFVRDYLLSIHWNKEPPIPTLPEEVVARTAAKYREAFERITGIPLE
jgi:phosphoribosylaminoimidazole-succinocarboxamide synthase